jgi:tetratricopeptide (TPR) repeat protein
VKKRCFVPLGCLLLFIGCATHDSVEIREEQLVIPTWEIGPAEANPTFAWSSPRRPVYPYPYKEILTNEKGEETYTACWLENEFIKVLVLPEIGGRLHGAKDKTNDYNFFYWQPTIKPALIGMTGAWISGGIEWNFPYGHRPTGFSPVSYSLEENEDGSRTVWIGETEWVNRMRWVIGLTVHPGRSIIEAKVRLMNPAPLHHSYYMWATTAVNANENYQAIYPTRLMTEHGKFEFFRWPIHEGVDISWWKNIPNASSFFAVERGDFFGGYDHGKQAGTILTGNKNIVIGKKLWSWGTSPFGRIWEPILTEDQGPYLEPQAGAFADNQPDNHWLEPGEIKSFSFFFYPVRDIGPFKQANIDGALNLEFAGDTIDIGAYSTAVHKSAIIRLTRGDDVLMNEKVKIDPSRPFQHQLEVADASDSREDFRLCLLNADGEQLVSYSPSKPEELPFPKPAAVYGAPVTIASVDELWQIGDFKSRYKYQDRRAGFDEYFKEALRRDPGHAPSHISLAEWDLKRGDYRTALRHLEAAEQRHPDNGRIFYMQGIAKEALGEYDAAFDLYYRAVHFQQYLSRAYQCITRLDVRRGDYDEASEHICKAIQSNTLNPQLWALKATVLRLNGDPEQALVAAEQALAIDPINCYALNEQLLAEKARGQSGEVLEEKLEQVLLDDPNCYIELALHYLNAGLHEEATGVLEQIEADEQSRNPLTGYYYAYCLTGSDHGAEAARIYTQAAQRPVDYCFPFRLESINVFRAALEVNPSDGRAHYFLGLVYGGLGEVDSAMSHWQQAVRLESDNARAWRNLGLAHLNVSGDLQAAMRCYTKAFELLPTDSRILLELDKVRQARKESTAERLTFLRKHQEVVESRDDLLTSMLSLMVQEGEYEQALEYYRGHHFHNWEGGYSIHNAYMEANIGMARKAGTPAEKLECYQRACEYPTNLEFAPREPNLRGFLYYPMARLYRELNDSHRADSLLKITAEERTAMSTLSSYYQALALRELGQGSKADRVLSALEREGQRILSGDKTGYERRGDDLLFALGHYYLAKVHEAYGRESEARKALERAVARLPMIERQALIFAQVTYAGAHQ